MVSPVSRHLPSDSRRLLQSLARSYRGEERVLTLICFVRRRNNIIMQLLLFVKSTFRDPPKHDNITSKKKKIYTCMTKYLENCWNTTSWNAIAKWWHSFQLDQCEHSHSFRTTGRESRHSFLLKEDKLSNHSFPRNI